MDSVDFFRDPLVAIPLERDSDDFEPFLKQRIRAYGRKVEDINSMDDILQEIRTYSDTIHKAGIQICKVVRLCLDGQIRLAANRLRLLVKTLKPHLDKLYTDEISQHLDDLYRLRVSSEALASRSQIFHIPLNERHLVGPQRFSMQGCPCLYLGGSIYVCWEELGRPDIHGLFMSHYRLRPNKVVKLLDLGFRPSHIAELVKHYWPLPHRKQWVTDLAVSYAVCWPLFAAAFVRVRHRQSPFKPEYIVPQLLLQWVAEDPDHDGIRYSSVNVVNTCSNSLAISNFVFPIKSRGRVGLCPQLRDTFEMTQPLSWQVADLVAAPGGRPKQFQLVIDGLQLDYMRSKFYRTECTLMQMEHAQV